MNLVILFLIILFLSAAFIIYELRHALELTDEMMQIEEGNDPDGPDLIDGLPIDPV